MTDYLGSFITLFKILRLFIFITVVIIEYIGPFSRNYTPPFVYHFLTPYAIQEGLYIALTDRNIEYSALWYIIFFLTPISITGIAFYMQEIWDISAFFYDDSNGFNEFDVLYNSGLTGDSATQTTLGPLILPRLVPSNELRRGTSSTGRITGYYEVTKYFITCVILPIIVLYLPVRFLTQICFKNQQKNKKRASVLSSEGEKDLLNPKISTVEKQHKKQLIFYNYLFLEYWTKITSTKSDASMVWYFGSLPTNILFIPYSYIAFIFTTAGVVLSVIAFSINLIIRGDQFTDVSNDFTPIVCGSNDMYRNAIILGRELGKETGEQWYKNRHRMSLSFSPGPTTESQNQTADGIVDASCQDDIFNMMIFITGFILWILQLLFLIKRIQIEKYKNHLLKDQIDPEYDFDLNNVSSLIEKEIRNLKKYHNVAASIKGDLTKENELILKDEFDKLNDNEINEIMKQKETDIHNYKNQPPIRTGILVISIIGLLISFLHFIFGMAWLWQGFIIYSDFQNQNILLVFSFIYAIVGKRPEIPFKNIKYI